MKKAWNKKIWIAEKIGTLENDYGTEIPIYNKPQKYMMNVQPLSGESDIAEFGEKANQIQRAVIEYKKYFGKFKEFDIAYLDGNIPDEKDGTTVKVSELEDNGISILDEVKEKYVNTEELTYYVCENANYRLYPPRNQNKVILLYFERLTAK